MTSTRLGLAFVVVALVVAGCGTAHGSGADGDPGSDSTSGREPAEMAPGGRSGGGGTPANPGVGPLPTDSGIYGAIPEGAFYLFREPYVRLNGNKVTRAINVADPGKRDLTFENPPRWLPNGGPDGRGAAQFDGDDDYGTATGFSFGAGSNPSILVVMQFDNVDDRISVAVQLNDGTSNPLYFLHAGHFRTRAGDLYRANGHPIGVPHSIDYLTPEASRDLGPHLHETHMYASGMIAAYDGRLFDGGGGQGTKGAMNTLRIGSNALGGPHGSEHAAMQVSEIVITEGRTPAQAAAYRERRIRLEYPSIGL